MLAAVRFAADGGDVGGVGDALLVVFCCGGVRYGKV